MFYRNWSKQDSFLNCNCSERSVCVLTQGGIVIQPFTHRSSRCSIPAALEKQTRTILISDISNLVSTVLEQSQNSSKQDYSKIILMREYRREFQMLCFHAQIRFVGAQAAGIQTFWKPAEDKSVTAFNFYVSSCHNAFFFKIPHTIAIFPPPGLPNQSKTFLLNYGTSI